MLHPWVMALAPFFSKAGVDSSHPIVARVAECTDDMCEPAC